MKYNRDGTRYQVETVIEAIESLCAKKNFPYLGDLLGSDWGFCYSNCSDSPEAYKALAIECAKLQYAPSTGFTAELKQEREELKDCLSDLEGQYAAEFALYGDAGPGQGLTVQEVRARIHQIDRELQGEAE